MAFSVLIWFVGVCLDWMRFVKEMSKLVGPEAERVAQKQEEIVKTSQQRLINSLFTSPLSPIYIQLQVHDFCYAKQEKEPLSSL